MVGDTHERGSMTGSWWNTALPEQTFPSEGRQQDSPSGLSRQQPSHTTSPPPEQGPGRQAQGQVAFWEGGSDFLEEPKQERHSLSLHFPLCPGLCSGRKGCVRSGHTERVGWLPQRLLGPRGCWNPGEGWQKDLRAQGPRSLGRSPRSCTSHRAGSTAKGLGIHEQQGRA